MDAEGRARDPFSLDRVQLMETPNALYGQ